MSIQLRKMPIKPERKVTTHTIRLMSGGDKVKWMELNARISFPSYAINPTIELVDQDCTTVSERDYYQTYACSHDIIESAKLVLTWQEQEELSIFNERIALWEEEVRVFDQWQKDNAELIKMTVEERRAAKKKTVKQKKAEQLQREIKKLEKQLKELK